MRASRGMGAIRASKMPKGKTITRTDNPDKVKVFRKGGSVKKADGGPISAISKRIDEIGSYKTASGKRVRTADLPPDDRANVRAYGAIRDLSREAGDEESQKKWQGKVNDLYKKQAQKKGYAKGGNFIQEAIKKPGALHAQLGVPKGKKIPAKMLSKAAKAPGKLGQRARFAQVLKGMKKK